jgi:hypothetical protein
MVDHRGKPRQIGESIILETGRPDKNNASAFSRFVLPFRWQANPVPGRQAVKGSLRFKSLESPPHYAIRKKYFTHETAKVLFERAQWLELADGTGSSQDGAFVRQWKDSAWACDVPLTLPDGSTITIAMDRPRMVLFEWALESESAVLKTGFLIVDLYFKPKDGERKPILDDLLALNEFFRYIDCPHPEHYDKERGYCFHGLFEAAPMSFINRKLEELSAIEMTDMHSPYFDRWKELLELPVEIAGRAYRLVSKDAIEKAKEFLSGDKAERGFLIYADDRAYVWSAASLQKGVAGLNRLARSSSTDAHDYGHWVKLLNVDSPGESPSKTHSGPSQFERIWAKKRTYKRWQTSGTWYGFSYHGGAMLTASTIKDNPGKSRPNPYVHHFSTLYFDLAILLFYLRVTLFRFSNELSRLAEHELEKKYQEFRALRAQFARFTILYQFPILSNLQQSIEMYQLARKHFDIDAFYKEVKDEIQETHSFLEMDGSKKLTKAATRLAMWGLPLAAIGVSAGVLSMMIAEIGADNLHIWDCVAKYTLDECAVRKEAWVLLGATFVLAIPLAFVGWLLLRVAAWTGGRIRRICREWTQG